MFINNRLKFRLKKNNFNRFENISIHCLNNLDLENISYTFTNFT